MRKFRTIDIFETDLGFNLKGPVNLKPGQANDNPYKLKIKDEFIVRYKKLYGTYVSKCGHIGPITFYEDVSMDANQMQVFKEENIYEIEYNENDSMTPREYLSGLLENLDEEEIPEDINVTNIKKDVIYTNMPEEIERPDMSLPKEQYIQALIDMKKKQAKLQDGVIQGKKN